MKMCQSVSTQTSLPCLPPALPNYNHSHFGSQIYQHTNPWPVLILFRLSKEHQPTQCSNKNYLHLFPSQLYLSTLPYTYPVLLTHTSTQTLAGVKLEALLRVKRARRKRGPNILRLPELPPRRGVGGTLGAGGTTAWRRPRFPTTRAGELLPAHPLPLPCTQAQTTLPPPPPSPPLSALWEIYKYPASEF